MNKFPYFRQLDRMDCGPTCLRMVAQYYGKHFTAHTVRRKAKTTREGVSMLGIARAAEELGFKSIGARSTIKQLVEDAPLPCILHWDQKHFVVLYHIDKPSGNLANLKKWLGGKNNPTSHNNANSEAGFTNRADELYFRIADPARGIITFSVNDFKEHWLSGESERGAEGHVLLLEPTALFDSLDEESTKSTATNIGTFQLLSHVWKFKKLISQLALGMVVGSLLQFLLPFLMMSLIDIGIEAHDFSFINLILIGQIALVISIATIDFLRSWILLHISTRLNLTIISQFLAKLMRLPVGFFDTKHFGDIMQRIGDHNRIESFLTGQTLSMFFSLFNILVFGILLSYLDLKVFLSTVGLSLLYVLWVLLFMNQRRVLDSTRFDISARNQSQIVQIIQGMQEIKLSGSELQRRWEWEHTQLRLFKWNVRNLSITQIQQAGALLINQGKNIFVTFLAAKAVIDGNLSFGGMLSIQYVLAQFNSPLEQMINFLQSWQDAKISIERLNEVHELDDEELPLDARVADWNQGDISIRNLSFSYPGAGNAAILKDIDLTIPYNKTTAIVGASGSGKTTLLKLLLRFYEPDAGRIFIRTNDETDGNFDESIDIATISFREWRQGCGAVMQDGFIFSDTIAKNIAAGEEEIDFRRLKEATRLANIHDFISSLPLGFNTRIGVEGNGISQGQKQRILIARAVYKDPKLLLFDEATNALDAKNESAIVRNLNSFFQGRTVIVVAHRLSTIRTADQIVVMENGRIVETGDHDDLINRRGKYFDLVNKQLTTTIDL
ncbi:peptidase domain-containing ABC transporter [Dyadobacter endophyticus]|nr:peptidase domain-containing ABC transporter [Dyadobacter endophyticus]